MAPPLRSKLINKTVYSSVPTTLDDNADKPKAGPSRAHTEDTGTELQDLTRSGQSRVETGGGASRGLAAIDTAAEALPRPSTAAKSPSTSSPIAQLREHLSQWVNSHSAECDDEAGEYDGDAAGGEYEMLLDRHVPDAALTLLKSHTAAEEVTAAGSAITAHGERRKHHDVEGNRVNNDDDGDKDGDDAQRLLEGGDHHHHGLGNAAMSEPEDSPYAEVRAAVRNYDEDLPCNTIRAWCIGLSLVFFGASTNTLFSLRQPSIGLGALIAQIIAWPMGHAWSKVMPTTEFTTFGVTWSLNPGPFNIKEHAIIVVMASVSFSVAYATDIILAQLIFYKQNFGIAFQIMLVVSTQSIGYGIAGLMRRFLVYPASMIWPGNLVAVTLMNAMYETDEKLDPTVFGGTIPRYRWFSIVTVCAFLYYFIPNWFAQFLSVFAFPTWMAPDNAVVNQLFGGVTGLSILPITFDWTQISGYVGSPLIPPWVAIANTTLGVIIFFVILSAILHYSGAWYAEFLPMSDSSTYDNTGARYNVSRILTDKFTLDVEAYQNYSPLFLSTTFALSYGLSFAAITSLLSYTFIHHRKHIWRQYRNSTHEPPDIHMKMMQKYQEAPSWWYFSLFAVMLALGFATTLGYPTNITWWSFLLAVAIAFSFALPIGIIQATTNNQIGLNVLTELIYGYIQPGRPLGLMLFKTYGYITMAQALNFVSDLKFGHYMKIPPRTMFLSQVAATTLSCFIQVSVLNFALTNIDGICELDQPQRFTCPTGRVFFSASVIWGLIGPSRIFSPGQIYAALFLFFPIGMVTPFILYWLSRRYGGPASSSSLAARSDGAAKAEIVDTNPELDDESIPDATATNCRRRRRPHSHSNNRRRLRLPWLRHLMAPLIFGGAGAIPPATPLNYLSWGLVGLLFQYYIKRRYFAWWTRLNFLTSNALDLGAALAALTLFLAVVMAGGALDAPRWWGNRVSAGTMDFKGTAVQRLVGVRADHAGGSGVGAGGIENGGGGPATFGPATW